MELTFIRRALAFVLLGIFLCSQGFFLSLLLTGSASVSVACNSSSFFPVLNKKTSSTISAYPKEAWQNKFVNKVLTNLQYSVSKLLIYLNHIGQIFTTYFDVPFSNLVECTPECPDDHEESYKDTGYTYSPAIDLNLLAGYSQITFMWLEELFMKTNRSITPPSQPPEFFASMY